MRLFPLPVAAALLASSAAPVLAQAAATTLEADTPLTTPSGSSFTAPAGWTRTGSPGLTVLTAPEGDLRVVVADVPKAADANAAVAAAWAAHDPKANRKVQVSAPMAAANGWDEQVGFAYETAPAERAVVQAIAHRKGSDWTVVIFDGKMPTFEKRASSAMLVMQSQRPAGFTAENFAGKAAAPLDAARVAELKGFIQSAMTQLDIPGVGFALLDANGVLFEGGLGVRKLGDPAPVTADTRFMIASNTKGLTTLLLAKLVDEGRIRWDQPVTEVYPPFRLGSDATTAKVQMQHLICACTGLPRKDFPIIFGGSKDMPSSETFRLLAATEPTSGFGEGFQYSNTMAAAAGFVAGQVLHPGMELGAAYDKAIADKVFKPLGMRETTFSLATALKGDHASPHYSGLDGKPAILNIEFNSLGYPFRPTGGAWSTPRDMIRYVDNELRQGKLPNGTQAFTAANVLERRRAGVPVGADSRYGMGLITTNVAGVKVVHHGGDVGGFKSDIYVLPEAGVGAVLLTNADTGVHLLVPFMRKLVEVLYGAKPQADAEVSAAAGRLKAQAAQVAATLQVPPDPATAAALAPRYSSPDLGTLTVKHDGPNVTFRFTGWEIAMGSRKAPDGTTSMVTAGAGLAGWLPFIAGTKDGKRTLTIRDGQHEYTYTETP